jgi:hypothetical protein
LGQETWLAQNKPPAKKNTLISEILYNLLLQYSPASITGRTYIITQVYKKSFFFAREKFDLYP